jgi:hypothetical protein
VSCQARESSGKLRALESERGVHLSRRIPAIALAAFAQPKDRVQADIDYATEIELPIEYHDPT